MFFYQATNGFNKEFKSLEVSMNEEEIKEVSTGNLWVLNNSYVFKFKNNLFRDINYTYEICPINDFKWKIGNNYYSWLNIYDKTSFVSTNKKNLNKYFVLEEKKEVLILKPTKSVYEIIEENSSSNDGIEFPSLNLLSDFFILKLRVNNKDYSYSFGIKGNEVVA